MGAGAWGLGPGAWGRRLRGVGVLLLLVVVLAGCRPAEVVETQEWAGRVFLPLAPQGEAMCTKLCRHVRMIEAQTRCEAEVWRQHVEEARVVMPDDCWGDNLLPFMEE